MKIELNKSIVTIDMIENKEKEIKESKKYKRDSTIDTIIIIGILELILSLLPGLIMVFKLIACLIDCFTYDWSGIGMIVNNTFYNIFW